MNGEGYCRAVKKHAHMIFQQSKTLIIGLLCLLACTILVVYKALVQVKPRLDAMEQRLLRCAPRADMQQFFSKLKSYNSKQIARQTRVACQQAPVEEHLGELQQRLMQLEEQISSLQQEEGVRWQQWRQEQEQQELRWQQWRQEQEQEQSTRGERERQQPAWRRVLEMKSK